MILVDEYAALPALVGRPPVQLAGEALALTYSRAYRLTRALLDPGPGRLATRGRFTRLVEALSAGDQLILHERLADPLVHQVPRCDIPAGDRHDNDDLMRDMDELRCAVGLESRESTAHNEAAASRDKDKHAPDFGG